MVKNLSKSVWVARELKFCMNMLCWFKYEIVDSNLEFFEIRVSDFVKNPDIFLRQCQKCVEELKVRNKWKVYTRLTSASDF
jgi:hypothetical protein